MNKKCKIFFLAGLIAITFGSCEKGLLQNDNSIPGLPPATETGAGTLGFLLNGVPWVPGGNTGTLNLSIRLDTALNDNRFIIEASRSVSQNYTEFKMSFRTNINFSFPGMINPSRFGFVSFKDEDNCTRSTNGVSNISNTSISISKNDKTNKIVSGAFECTILNPACGETIKITKGRFDMKY